MENRRGWVRETERERGRQTDRQTQTEIANSRTERVQRTEDKICL
jgi:hypothetical protein